MTRREDKTQNAVIFAGAGASKAVSADRYPTTVEFFDKLPDSIRQNSLFALSEQFLKKDDPDRVLDIEEILWELQSLRLFSREVVEDRSFVGHALKEHRLAHVLLGANYNFNHLEQTMSRSEAALDEIIGAVNAAVYDFYDYEPSESELAENWLYLLGRMQDAGWDADIFTTNYDIAIETAVMIDGKLPYESFVGLKGGPRKRLDLESWNLAESTDRHLTKLHGSIDWQFRGQDIYVGSPVYTGDHMKQAIIYPGFKGESDTDFFRVMHAYLGRRLEEADVCVFIGFAFRDEYVNRLIRERMKSNCRMVVINPAKKLTFPRARTHFHIKQGFDRAAVDRAIYG